jgi:hypothetical protein
LIRHSASAAPCFLDLDLNGDGAGDYNRWGWTNGPLRAPADGGINSYSFDIYAGAGQCDVNKGTLVGWLTVYYDGSSATVMYNAFDGFNFEETHLYIGSEPLAQDVNGNYSIAPGQYTVTGSDTQYVIDGLSGDIYIVAHAVVSGF